MPHRNAAPANASEGANSTPDDRRTGAPQSLIDELEDALAKQDMHARAAVMRRVTDLFIANGTGFSEEHIAMFDDVMSRLVIALDSRARAEFGDLLAKHPNAPEKTSRILALDEDVEVAGPVLSHSKKLDEATLVEGAKTRSQDHLFAISLRESIGEAVTDILVERGDSNVVASTVANPGAKFSEFGSATLATRSRDDGKLALQVWMRTDIPRQHLLSLFATASEDVQKQLEVANRQKAELYRYMVAQAKSQIQTKMREDSSSFAEARTYVESLHRSGSLSAEDLLEFAQDRKFDELTVALALMCDLPISHIERAIVHNQADHLLVLAKALGLSWETTKAILAMRAPNRNSSAKEPEALCASFMKLQAKTAVSALQFYRLRARAESPLETN